MKKINDSRKLIGATSATALKELNTLYKGLMKTHHPDRFPNDEEKRHEAEELSKHLIDAYKFLESIHPETHAVNAEDLAHTPVLATYLVGELVCERGAEYESSGNRQSGEPHHRTHRQCGERLHRCGGCEIGTCKFCSRFGTHPGE